MPCLGKPETWEQTAWSPEGSRKRLGRKGGPPQAWPHRFEETHWGGVGVGSLFLLRKGGSGQRGKSHQVTWGWGWGRPREAAREGAPPPPCDFIMPPFAALRGALVWLSASSGVPGAQPRGLAGAGS